MNGEFDNELIFFLWFFFHTLRKDYLFTTYQDKLQVHLVNTIQLIFGRENALNKKPIGQSEATLFNNKAEEA